jgi:hypothetical protein
MISLGARDRTDSRDGGLEYYVLVEHVGNHLDLGLCCCDLLGGRGLGAALAEEEGHFWYVVCVVVSLVRVCVGRCAMVVLSCEW